MMKVVQVRGGSLGSQAKILAGTIYLNCWTVCSGSA